MLPCPTTGERHHGMATAQSERMARLLVVGWGHSSLTQEGFYLRHGISQPALLATDFCGGRDASGRSASAGIRVRAGPRA